MAKAKEKNMRGTSNKFATWIEACKAKIRGFFDTNRFGIWLKNHAPTKRRIIQIYAALLFNSNIKGFFGKGNNVIYRGDVKYLCTPGLNCYSCPGAIGACPLGALQNALSASKTRAPMYILGILALLGIMLGRTICGYLCPTGLVQDLLYKIRTPKLQKSRYTRILSYFKYVLLIVFVIAIPLIYSGIPAFCKYVCPAGTFGGAGGLLSNPENAGFFGMLGELFTWKFILLIVFMVGSVFIYRFFCRFFCPLGAILGFFNKIAFIGIKLDKQKCTECGLCIRTCKMDIKHVGDHECINCGACVAVCPTKAITWKGSQFFLRPNETDMPTEQVEKVSLADMVKNGASQASDLATAFDGANNAGEAFSGDYYSSFNDGFEGASSDNNNFVSDANGNYDADYSTPELAASEQTEVVGDSSEVSKIAENQADVSQADVNIDSYTAGTDSARKIKKRKFWLQFAAWVAAIAVLIVALVYFNVLAPTNDTTVYGVGDRCPDFTLSTFETSATLKEDGTHMTTFSTIDHKGTVMVINFWYTTCDPCVEELPEFAKVKDEFGDSIIMVAVHAAGFARNDEIVDFI
ncbi:MAG: 4Fe-4S binding protein, partial [Clostridia bacterium]|nr:4Fe-4S binding protein [Clostridia bacterium]